MTRRRARAVGAALVGVLLVTGCSVRVVDGDETTPPAPDGRGAGASDDPADPAPDASAAPVTPRADGAAPRGAGGTGAALLDRAALLADVTRSSPCGPDVTVEQAGSVVELTGDCGTLTVAGAGSRVVAGHVGHLVVEGGAVQVVVASADRVTVDAASVRVAWESGEPQVDVSGADAAYGLVGTVRLATDD